MNDTTDKQNVLDITVPFNDTDALREAARRLVNALDDYTVVTFTGDLGAGKTTFISEICKLLGVSPEETSSPSFAIINEYRSDTTAELIYHFDLYRLKNLEEALDLGLEDYLECGALCLIEWPQVAQDILPDDTVSVDITVDADKNRNISVRLPR